MKEAKPWGDDGPTIEVGERDPETGRIPVKMPTGLRRVSGSSTPLRDLLRELRDERGKSGR